jgi:predicted TIM-barrel fold metal-dependent hydrolase
VGEQLFFDCNVIYGPRPNLPRLQRWSLDHLLEDMDHYGIAASLVRHEQAVFHDFPAGNLRLVDEISAHRDRLFPCWVVAPNLADDVPSVEEWGAPRAEHEVRAVQFMPKEHGLPVLPQVFTPMAEMVAARGALCVVGVTSFSDPGTEVAAFCEIFAKSPVLLTGCHWGSYRLLSYLMSACPNLHLEFSDFQANRVVEHFAGRFGADRLLFGSGFPAHSGGAARGMLDWTLLNDEAATLVAGGNLCRLLAVNVEELSKPDESLEPIQAAGRRGEALTGLVIDAHCHVMGDGEMTSGGLVMRHGDASGQLELSERCGIDLTAMMSWQGPVSGDPVAGNALMATLVSRHPNDLVGLVSIDPLQQTEVEMVTAIERLTESLPFPGIKPYFPRNAIHYHAEEYSLVWELANQYKLYTLLHTNQTAAAVDGVVELAKRYPDVSFLFAHVGGCWNYAELCAAAAQQVPNVYCELTLTPVLNGVVEFLVENAGQDRVLFGTDAPMRDPRPQLGWVVHSRLSTEAKKDVLGRNFLNILERCQAPGMGSVQPRLQELRAKA